MYVNVELIFFCQVFHLKIFFFWHARSNPFVTVMLMKFFSCTYHGSRLNFTRVKIWPMRTRRRKSKRKNRERPPENPPRFKHFASPPMHTALIEPIAQRFHRQHYFFKAGESFNAMNNEWCGWHINVSTDWNINIVIKFGEFFKELTYGA